MRRKVQGFPVPAAPTRAQPPRDPHPATHVPSLQLTDVCWQQSSPKVHGCLRGHAQPCPSCWFRQMYNNRRSSLVAQAVKNLPAVQETWVRSLGQEDPLKKGMATHSSILAWRIPWTEEPGRLQSMGSQRVGRDRATNTHTHTHTHTHNNTYPPLWDHTEYSYCPDRVDFSVASDFIY